MSATGSLKESHFFTSSRVRKGPDLANLADYVRLHHFHDGKSIVFENSICTFVWNQHHSRTLSEGIRFGGSSGMPTNCDHFWQEGSFVVCPTVIQKNIETVFVLRYCWAFVRGGGWEGGVNRVSRKYLLSINTYYTLSQIWKKSPFWFWLFSLLPYKKCNLGVASHAPRRLAVMKIRKIILCYCAQWCSSS